MRKITRLNELNIMSSIGKYTDKATPPRNDAWRMFDRIAHRYDFLNHVLSMRRDVAWRKRLSDLLPSRNDLRVLDLATGTGDVLLALRSDCARVRSGIGVDMAAKMLALGKQKFEDTGHATALRMVRGDATCLAIASDRFDVVTNSFGIRNVSDVDAALREMRRVLKPGGRALILEFSLPSNAILRWGYLLYFRHVLPHIGGIVSGDSYAYRYLNQTVETFPYGDAFCERMRAAGFRDVAFHPLTLGIAMIYQGDR
ncbi:MAG TPA: bifunctional demethylmenaquinone methyltransferase/2-methoxy-6-polyprenyl-1,4-benzoquinol methylase UbiE [Candidatus Hydrogenedentes bacterium]|nr:bifunctional demethylmenaquinone methyltransferase/2-methoxy-6-polyprenyl-1,4-benzoquinol methylase UbiE [Candidatus Hydrogenedentota bacterium]